MSHVVVQQLPESGKGGMARVLVEPEILYRVASILALCARDVRQVIRTDWNNLLGIYILVPNSNDSSHQRPVLLGSTVAIC